MTTQDLIHAYYFYEPIGDWTDEMCLSFFNAVSEMKISDIINCIETDFKPFELVAFDIPQFSSIDDVMNVPSGIIESGKDAVKWSELGFLITGKDKKEGAHLKYGENQGKTAQFMGLCEQCKVGKLAGFQITPLGRAFYGLSEKIKKILLPRLVLRSKLMQNYYLSGRQQCVIDDALMLCSSEATRIRRSSNVKGLISIIETAYR